MGARLLGGRPLLPLDAVDEWIAKLAHLHGNSMVVDHQVKLYH